MLKLITFVPMGMELKSDQPLSLRSSITNSGQDPDLIAKSIFEFIEMCRCTDDAIKAHISKEEFWERELKYSKLEEFAFSLTINNPQPKQ